MGVPDWYAQQYWEEVEAGYWEDEVCDSCGLDPCQCDRYFAEQNADYEGLVY
jgi:hypothetical protein